MNSGSHMLCLSPYKNSGDSLALKIGWNIALNMIINVSVATNVLVIGS